MFLIITCKENEGGEKLSKRDIITYGFNKQADFRIRNLKSEDNGSRFDVYKSSEMIVKVKEPIPDEYSYLRDDLTFSLVI